jgi:hypothetical protein
VTGDADPTEVEDLYGLPLDQFTAARNALAKELRDPEIKKLRKPSASAWAVNQVVREQRGEAARFLDAAARARAGAGDGLRAATAKLRDIESGLRRAATAKGAKTNDVNALLAAAASGGAAAERFQHGQLVGDESAVLPDLVDDADAWPPRPDEVDEARIRRREKLDAAARHAEEEASRLGRETGEAQARAERMAADARAAQEHADDLRAKTESAAAKAASARAEADGAGA